MKVAGGLQDALALRRELTAYQRTLGGGEHVKFAGKGEHDDLLIAVALAVWWARLPASGAVAA